MLNANDFNPKKNPSYSPNLFRWMKKNGYTKAYALVRPKYGMPKGAVLIGDIRPKHCDACRIEVHGNFLRPILNYGSRAGNFAYLAKSLTAADFKPLPNWFEQYKKKGYCHIDPKHALHLEQLRYTYTTDNKTRHCMYCGKTQVLVKTGEEVVEHFSWKDSKNTTM